jgi:uncharacterized RDD family membrane protein YckC
MQNGLPGYDRPPGYQPGFNAPYGAVPAVSTDGVMARRLVAYLLDIVFIFLFSGLLFLVISLLGVVTFGLGWALYAILPASGVIYSAITVGGSRQSTWGMRMAGLRAMNANTGGPVDTITAAFHALLFYLAVGTFLLWLVDVAFGFMRSDSRFGHDVLSGVAIVRH